MGQKLPSNILLIIKSFGENGNHLQKWTLCPCKIYYLLHNRNPISSHLTTGFQSLRANVDIYKSCLYNLHYPLDQKMHPRNECKYLWGSVYGYRGIVPSYYGPNVNSVCEYIPSQSELDFGPTGTVHPLVFADMDDLSRQHQIRRPDLLENVSSIDLESSLHQPILNASRNAIVDRVMEEFWVIFDREWDSGFRGCAGHTTTAFVPSTTGRRLRG